MGQMLRDLTYMRSMKLLNSQKQKIEQGLPGAKKGWNV